jgi:hypothetical protein
MRGPEVLIHTKEILITELGIGEVGNHTLLMRMIQKMWGKKETNKYCQEMFIQDLEKYMKQIWTDKVINFR